MSGSSERRNIEPLILIIRGGKPLRYMSIVAISSLLNRSSDLC